MIEHKQPARRREEPRKLLEVPAARAREAKEQEIAATIKTLTAPELQRKLLEHSYRERILTAMRRGQYPTRVPLKSFWICGQEMLSIHYIKLLEQEIAARGLGEAERLPESKIKAIIAEQTRIIEEGMRKAKGD